MDAHKTHATQWNRLADKLAEQTKHIRDTGIYDAQEYAGIFAEKHEVMQLLSRDMAEMNREYSELAKDLASDIGRLEEDEA